MDTGTRLKLANRLYGASTYLALYLIAGLVGLLPSWLQMPLLWGGVVAVLLAITAYRIERGALKIKKRAARTAETASPQSPTSIPRAPAVTPVDRQVEEALRFLDEAHAQLEKEEDAFPIMRALPDEESFAPEGGTIEMTFDDLGRLSTLVLDAVESHMTVVPEIDSARISKRKRYDVYHVRADGPRYDLRTLRSVS